jgi:DNA mismatch endonuclease (patch repair protein)
VNIRPVPGLRRTADLVFTRAKVAVFLDGCFWHGCPEHLRPSRINERFWNLKIMGNKERDQDTDRRLIEAGWTVLRVWEHEDPEAAARRVVEVVRGPRANRSGCARLE